MTKTNMNIFDPKTIEDLESSIRENVLKTLSGAHFNPDEVNIKVTYICFKIIDTMTGIDLT